MSGGFEKSAGKGRTRISQNSRVTEVTTPDTASIETEQVTNLDFFVSPNPNAKSPIHSLVRHISREVNRHKLNYSQLKYVFRSVRQRCGVEVGPASKRLVELPTQIEMEQFFEVISNPIHRLIFETLSNTGLRIAELCNLEVRRIDFKGNTVFVSQGKGKKDRVTFIGNRLKEKLVIYLNGKTNKFLFESNRNTKYSSRRIEQLCNQYRELAGIEKALSPHTFRHQWNTALAHGGISKERRAILAGHADERTQAIYTHLSGGGSKDEVLAILDSMKS